MTISALPTPPDRSDPATFSSRADAFLGALPTFATEANALATQANSDAAVAAAAAIGTLAASGTSTDSLTIGTGTKSFTTQTGKAITAGMTMKWAMQSDVAKYMTGTVTSYNASTGAIVMNMTDTAGSGTAAAWEGVVTAAAAGNGISRRAIIGADTVVYSDFGNIVEMTSGSFTLSFDTCANLGNGWWCYLKNVNAVAILNPSGAETIDGLAEFNSYPGECRLVYCDGSVLRSIVITGFRNKFTTTAAIYIPPGYAAFGHKIASASGGGGSGARHPSGTTTWGGYGGGGGGVHTGTTTGATAGAVLTITVGAKGTGGTAVTADGTNGNNGTAGGASGLSGGGFNVSVTGGGLGLGGANFGRDGASGGGVGAVGGAVQGFLPCAANTGANYSAEFGGSGGGSQYSTGTNYQACATVWGGGAGGGGCGYSTTTPTVTSAAGTSTYGGAGGAGGAVATNGSNGTASTTWGQGGGGGGGSSQNGTNSGAGGDGNDGFVDLWGII